MANENIPGVTPPMPQLPRFDFQQPTGDMSPAYGNIIKMLSQAPQSMVNNAIPAVANAFAPTGAALQPAINQIRESTGGNVANAQSDAMRRGMTGSDIEAAGMTGARVAGQARESELVGNASLQQAHTLAQSIMQAYGMDINANAEMFKNLAQAIGQKLASDETRDMFMKQLQAGLDMAHTQGNYQLLGSVLGAGGSMGAAYMTGPTHPGGI